MNDIPEEQSKFKSVILNLDENTQFNVKYKNYNNSKCILWLPGRNDYFYHYHISSKLYNYDIYSPFYRNCHELKDDVSDYIYDISLIKKEIDIMYEYFNLNNYDEVILYGHSTGGLIAILYQEYTENKINKIILNAPWLHYKFKFIDHYLFNYFFYYVIPYLPEYDLTTNRSFKDNKYMLMLSSKFNINKLYKKNYNTPVISSWFRNIIKYQSDISNNKIKLKYDTLILISDHTAKFKGAETGDEILDIEQHLKQISKLGDKVKLNLIKDATHDVLSSNYNSAIDESFNLIHDFLV
tara:strand:+ start:1246 stop:2133 length:888 start_codon:yes stop_codon:yes gene_type:complete